MRHFAVLAVLLGLLVPVGAADYVGSVGKLEASFSLEWHDDGTVTGSYHYPARAGVTYRLVGSNPREGELFLAEFTGDKLTARCRLRKRLEGKRIVWEGQMDNTDGRRFPMVFARERGAGAGAATAFVDDFERGRTEALANLRREYRWTDFPRSDEVVAMVPVDFEGGHYFNGRVVRFETEPAGSILEFEIGEFDGSEIRYGDVPSVTLRASRQVPIPAEVLVGRGISVQLDRRGDLLALDLSSLVVTHVRESVGGKLEIRGALDVFDASESYDWTPEEFALRMRAAPVVEFLPDKLALFHEPEFGVGEASFQVIRLVRDFGLVIQSTDAGPASLELESLSLDPEPQANPWISLDSIKERLLAPPHQLTDQAG